MKRLRIPAGLLALLLAAPGVAAAPNVTLRLENATLHQTLQKLAEQTHLTFESLDGAGEEAYQDPPDAPRASLDWKDTPLAQALRQVCRAFGCSVHKDAADYYHFMQGAEYQPMEQARDGLVFSLRNGERTRDTTFIPGAARAYTNDITDLRLVVRSEGTALNDVGAVTNLSAVDANGKPVAAHANRLPSNLALDDERFFRLLLFDLPAGVQRLKQLSGEVAIMKPVQERKLQIPLPKEGEPVHFPIDHQFGPIRVRIVRLYLANNGVEVTLRYSASGMVMLGNLERPDQLQLRGPLYGKLWPMTYSQRFGVGSDGQGYVEVQGYRPFDRRAVSLQLTVPVREGTARMIPFQLENVVVPSVRTGELQVHNVGDPTDNTSRDQGPRAFLDPKGGAVRLPAFGLSDQHGMRLAIGFARREAGGGWSPTRWMEREAFWDPVQVRALAPGAYRVQVRGAWITGDGSGSLKSLGTAEVTVQAGKAVLLKLTGTGAPGEPGDTVQQKPPD